MNKTLGHCQDGEISISSIRSDEAELSDAADVVEEFNRYFSTITSIVSRDGPISDCEPDLTCDEQRPTYFHIHQR